MQTTGINPSTVKLADLEVIEARQHSIQITTRAAQMAQPITARDARQRMIGMMKMINHFSGGDMREDINSIDFLVQRIDQLEAEHQRQHEEITALKKALSAIGTVLEVHDDPFELKPISRWSKADLGKWMIAAGESIQWVMQRAENELDKDHAVPIAKDPE